MRNAIAVSSLESNCLNSHLVIREEYALGHNTILSSHRLVYFLALNQNFQKFLHRIFLEFIERPCAFGINGLDHLHKVVGI